MAAVIMQRWDGFTLEQYEALREIVRWERDTEDQFDEFVVDRIAPGLERLEISGEPEKTVAPLHEVTYGH